MVTGRLPVEFCTESEFRPPIAGRLTNSGLWVLWRGVVQFTPPAFCDRLPFTGGRGANGGLAPVNRGRIMVNIGSIKKGQRRMEPASHGRRRFFTLTIAWIGIGGLRESYFRDPAASGGWILKNEDM